MNSDDKLMLVFMICVTVTTLVCIAAREFGVV